MRFLEGLEALGVQRAVLTSGDGLVIESTGKGSPGADLLASELVTIWKTMRVISANLGGEIRRFTFATEHKEVLAVLHGTYCVGALIEKGNSRQAVGKELVQIAGRLAAEL